MALDLIVVLNSLSGVKYHFCSFSMGHLYNIVKVKQILLSFQNFTSHGIFIYLKREYVFNRHERTIVPKTRKSSFLTKGCVNMGVCFHFFRTYLFLS